MSESRLKEWIGRVFGHEAEGVTVVPVDDVLRLVALAWDRGWQAGHDDYDQGTETPNPYRVTLSGSGGQS